MKIANDVSDVLGNSTIEGNNLYLSSEQLDRKLYVAVNKVLVSIGGKWNRKAKAHIFNESPQDILEQILLSGEYTDEKKEYQFFETPIELSKKLVEMAGIKEGESVLEPSAGKGRIASFINNCDCIEMNENNYKYLQENGFNVVGRDFISFDKKYDVIIANPPFTKQQDIDHVNHMIELSNRKVVSIMSSSVMFRSNKKTVDFRSLVDSLRGTIEMLPDKSFSESGTNVNSCVVSIVK